MHKRPFHHAAYVESASAYSVFAGHGRSVLAGNVFLQRRLQGAEAKDPRHGLSRCAVNDHNIRLLCVHNIHGVPQHEAVFSFRVCAAVADPVRKIHGDDLALRGLGRHTQAHKPPARNGAHTPRRRRDRGRPERYPALGQHRYTLRRPHSDRRRYLRRRVPCRRIHADRRKRADKKAAGRYAVLRNAVPRRAGAALVRQHRQNNNASADNRHRKQCAKRKSADRKACR